jgi:hypothetical protein
MDEALIRGLGEINLSDSLRIKLNSELIRLSSFKDWSGEIFAIRLAEAGFFYTGVSDKVRCYFCNAEKENWSSGDQPNLVHKKLNANCPLVVNSVETNNIPIYSNLLEEPLPSYFDKISHLLGGRTVQHDQESVPEASGNLHSMSHSSDSTQGSRNLPGGSRDSSIGSTESQENRGGRGNSQEGGSAEQPPQRFSLGLSGL